MPSQVSSSFTFEHFLNTLPFATRNDPATVVTLTLDAIEQMVDAAYAEGLGDGFDEGVQADFDAEQEDAAEEDAAVEDYLARLDDGQPTDEELHAYYATQAGDDARVKAFLDGIADGTV